MTGIADVDVLMGSNAISLARHVAAGDLTLTIEAVTQDETGRLLVALGDMNRSLTQMVTEVRDSSDRIDTASNRLAVHNVELSARTALDTNWQARRALP